ncbi:PQQ-dependent sugar dehydrogenase [uncultured Hyphomicrobium sp.]|jgi:glucose/arabinose dehydrogenase|uniref:PQQ-dependent sugar dehydrogenase n=1 Tax=uncultured Hyphomicrobium sp. TaxID=194373 RepID=UPI0025EFF94E|nr:PQQ-dependent sugar dehydrogenase [uncultured Hyphomicrobium sp.]
MIPRLSLTAPLLFLMTPPAVAEQTNAPEAPKTAVTLKTVAKGLENPWALEFLPDGRMLVTEKAGRLRVVAKDGTLGDPISGVPEVVSENQAGLLDVALAPDYLDSGRIYFSYSEPREGGANATSLARARLVLDGDNGKLEDLSVIFRQEPAFKSFHHFGSRIAFADDGTLFLTTGERNIARQESQNPANTVGKVIHITGDGAAAADNPKIDGWDPKVWSIGHRNVQGAAIDPATGKLWTLEHGPQGGDELNQPEAGKNYGWPIIIYGKEYSGSPVGEGITSKPGLEQPVYYWNPSIATSSLTFYTGDLFPGWKGSILVGALKYMHVQRLVMKDGKVVAQEILADDIGERVRDVKQGPDGAIYLVTDDANGRIVRMAPQ